MFTVLSNAEFLRNRILARDQHSTPDNYAEQQRRQNNGGFCSQCGSTQGHYGFCLTVNATK